MHGKFILDIGCGENKLEEVIGLDVRRRKDVAVIVDNR